MCIFVETTQTRTDIMSAKLTQLRFNGKYCSMKSVYKLFFYNWKEMKIKQTELRIEELNGKIDKLAGYTAYI